MHHKAVATTTTGTQTPLVHRVCRLVLPSRSSLKHGSWSPFMKLGKGTMQYATNAPLAQIGKRVSAGGLAAAVRHTASNSLFVSYRACSSSAGTAASKATGKPELISIDAIEIETSTSTEEHHVTSSSTATLCAFPPTAQHKRCAPPQQQHRRCRPRNPCDMNAANEFTGQHIIEGAPTVPTEPFLSDSNRLESNNPLGAAQPQQTYCDAHTTDTFARGRVINFIRRMGHSAGTVFHVQTMTPAQAAAATGSATGPTLYSATCQLPLPEPHGSRVAEGIAEDAKEAEVLAAMHAERVCDALGVQLFRLRTAQQKHADAVRKEEGRYAPYPDDPIKPLGTPVPPPMRLLRSRRRDTSKVPNVTLAQQTLPGAPKAIALEQTRSLLSRIPPAPRDTQLCSEVWTSPSTEVGAGGGVSVSASLTTAGVNVSVSCSVGSAAAAGNPKTFDSTKIVLHRHDPISDYATLVSHYTDDEHAERVRTYSSSAYYPWVGQWEGVSVTQAGASTAPNGGAISNDGTSAGTLGQVFDPTEGGLWCMVNERNMRCSPTPQDALVLPIVYDGPCAEARIKDYYIQHSTSLEEHLTVCAVSGSSGSPQRMIQAELRLIGLTVTAKGKAQTEQMAIHLAAMHAELLLDALGHPLFPADPQRQARHAEAVLGYGRWAMNPLTGRLTSPNPHDALPLPLKIQIGTDEIWLRPEVQRQLGHRWSDSEHIMVAMQQLNMQMEDEIEINPPVELLEEAEQLLKEWQTHIAKSRFTHLFVLFDMENAYQATTILPVPLQYGIRGGLGIGKTRKMAVQVCSLHALDTLCSLGVPLCVDPERERRYLQCRSALGMVLQSTRRRAVDRSQIGPQLAWGFSEHSPSPVPGLAGKSPRMSDNDSGGGVPRLPTYIVEGSHVRLLPHISDTLHAMQQRIPDDYCLFGGAREEVLVEIGNQVRVAVQNYLQAFLEQLMRNRSSQHGDRSRKEPRRNFGYPGAVFGRGDAVPENCGNREGKALPVETVAKEKNGREDGDKDTASRPAASMVEDNVAQTQAWATQYEVNILPHNMISGYGRHNSFHNTSFLQVPIPTSALLPLPATSHNIDASAVSSPSPPHSLAGPVYAIAIGTSLKRKDAERACFLHAASILHSFGVDVLAQYPRGLPRVRQVLSFADAAKFLSKEPLSITSPFLADGTLRASEEGAAAHKSMETVASSPLVKEESDSASPVPPPGSLHPPRPVMHTNMKDFLESARGITLPRKRKVRQTGTR